MNKWIVFPDSSDVGFNGFGRIDPYIDWAFGDTSEARLASREASASGSSAASGLDDRRWYPILLTLRKHTADQFASGEIFKKAGTPADWNRNVRVTPGYRQPHDQFGDRTYFTALVTAGFFRYFSLNRDTGKALRNAISRMAVSRFLFDGTYPVETSDGTGNALPPPSGDPEPGLVVMGVIDDGIAFANKRFRTADNKTRVEGIWIQDAEWSNAHDAPPYCGYGRHLGKAEIDAAFADSTFNGTIDEDAVYRSTGATDFTVRIRRAVTQRASHGTHVMDIACGYEPGDAPGSADRPRDDRPIVCVQIPADTSEGTSAASLDTFVIDGIRYILDQADAIARSRGCGRLPVVINISFGAIADRHDGTSDIELAIDELIAARRKSGNAPLEVVLPAGNNRLTRSHAEVRFDKRIQSKKSRKKAKNSGSKTCKSAAIRSLSWRVLPDDRTTSHLEVWLPAAPSSHRHVKLRITPPNGRPSKWISQKVGPVHVYGDNPAKDRETGVCEVRYSHVPHPTNRGMFLVTLAPTKIADFPNSPQEYSVPAPSGVWIIEIRNIGLAPDEIIHAYIQRDDTRFGYPVYGRQSYFTDENYVPLQADGTVPEHDNPESAIKRAGTLNSIAAGSETIVIGGFVRKTMEIADYSGAGPVPAPYRNGPDASAVSDDSPVRSGILGAGNRSGSGIAVTGTSVAAPQITRMIADLLADGKAGDRAAICKIAQSQESERHGHKRDIDAERTGCGRILVNATSRPNRHDT